MAGRLLLIVVLMTTWPATAQPQPQNGELIERTLAIVGGEAVTLADVQTAMALGLVDAREVDAATERLVERVLILREVQRYAPPEPPDDAVDARLAEIRSSIGDPKRLVEIMAAGGFTDERLRAWVRDDLRIASYLEQRFAAAGAASADLIVDWIADLRRRATIVELWKR